MSQLMLGPVTLITGLAQGTSVTLVRFTNNESLL